MVESKLDHIVETLRNGRGTQKACLLIGAGCSVAADIPTAAGFVEEIKKRYPIKYDLADPKTYPYCMKQLFPNERRALIREFVEKSALNWAHVCIAILVREGYVDRVLTTNFDPLIVRACALLNVFPAVFDFAASPIFNADAIVDEALFHLHGQSKGFVMLHTLEELEKQKDRLKPVFEDAGRGRTWIVVGYSGDSDPVFENLAEVKEFGGGLYWLAYKDNPPGKHVYERLLSHEGKGASLVTGFDADRFFIELTQKLGCFPPPLIAAPFTHLGRCLDMLTEFPIPGEGIQQDILGSAREKITKAKEQFEFSKDPVTEVIRLLMEGNYEDAIGFQSEVEGTPALRGPIASAFLGLGYELVSKALKSTGSDADLLFGQAEERYEAALRIKPDMHGALNDWGNALLAWAETKSGLEADRMFEQAVEKYEAALGIKPDMHEAFCNWGTALLARAKTKSSAEADGLLRQACDKYEEALKIKPDKHEALSNWGTVLLAWAKTKSGAEADGLFRQACEKYGAALKIKPDMHEALYNWGTTLLVWAKTKPGAVADGLFRQSCEKYKAVLRIAPESYSALNSWAATLLYWACNKTGIQAQQLYLEAEEKGREAERIRQGSAAYNLACIAAMRGSENECHQWLEKSRDAGTLPTIDRLKTDTDLDSVRDKEWFREFWAGLEKGGTKT